MDEFMIQAQNNYRYVKEILDEMGWYYHSDDVDLSVCFDVEGNDIPMDINITVDAQKYLVMLISNLNLNIPKERRLNLALAVSEANNCMLEGSFDYNYRRGALLFRMTSSYKDSEISKKVIARMIAIACNTVDEYNDKFEYLSQNDMTPLEVFAFLYQ